MLIRYPADGRWSVCLTDDPYEACIISQTEPVIGITGPEPEDYSLWNGIFYLAASVEAVDEAYAKLVWCRFHGVPVTVTETEQWCLREMDKTDLKAIKNMYQVKDIVRYLEHPTGGEEQEDAWKAWLDAYCRHVYRMDGPAMWILTDTTGKLLGRLGLEWREICGIEGWFLGYALMPEERGKGLITQAAQQLISIAEEQWEITEFYIACEKENQASIACAKRLGFELICENQLFMVFFMSTSIS